jgi:RNA polymerase sigma-70 factor (ECF subfamily)
MYTHGSHEAAVRIRSEYSLAKPKTDYTNVLSEVSIRVEQAVDWQKQLYEAKASELILYGRALGLSHSEAEDVLQETFVSLLKMERAPDNPMHYAVRGFRNKALNYKRGFLRRITRELESRKWFEQEAVESSHERAAMHCLQKLPPEQREVIVLKIWHEHTFEEIGELLQLSPNTVAGRYRYGMEKMRKCLAGSEMEFVRGEKETTQTDFGSHLSPLTSQL